MMLIIKKKLAKWVYFVVYIFQDLLSGIPDGSLPDTLAAIVKASYLEKLEVLNQNTFNWILHKKDWDI